jgi:ribosomal protein S18 acetylase RimI-like enzyme
MKIVEVGRKHVEALSRFFAALPDRDRTFIDDDVSDPTMVAALPARAGKRWVAIDEVEEPKGAEIAGLATVRPHSGWSSHVGTLHLVVHPDHRHGGVGTDLARHALASSLSEGLRKVQVEIAADHESAIQMFCDLGFTGEALLRGHIHDGNGNYNDLVVLAHIVDDTWAAMDTVGINEELGG